MKKLNIDNMSKKEVIDIYKQCFDLFVENEQSYKPVYYINGYEIDRRNFVIFKQAYYEDYASRYEKDKYDQMMRIRRNNRYERAQSKFKEAFTAFINGQDTEEFYRKLADKTMVSLETVKRYPELYYEKYATDEERKIYQEKKGIRQDIRQTEKENNVREKYKYIFDVCVNSLFNEDKIEELTEKYGISPKTINNYVIKYCELYANEQELERYKNAKKQVLLDRKKSKMLEPTEKYVEIFNYIINSESIKDAVFYLSTNNINIDYLKENVNKFHEEYPELDLIKIRETLKYYKKYNEYKINQVFKLEQEKKTKEIQSKIHEIAAKQREIKKLKYKKYILSMINIIKNFNDGNYKNYLTYCTKKKIEPEKFITALRITKKVNEPIYNSYIDKVKNQNRRNYPNETLEISKLASNLKNGQVDILDFYDNSSMDLEKLQRIAKLVCNMEDYKIINSFIEKNSQKKEFNINNLLKSEFTIVSYGTVYEINEKNSRSALRYLEKNNYPINDITFLSAIRRIESVKKKVA